MVAMPRKGVNQSCFKITSSFISLRKQWAESWFTCCEAVHETLMVPYQVLFYEFLHSVSYTRNSPSPTEILLIVFLEEKPCFVRSKTKQTDFRMSLYKNCTGSEHRQPTTSKSPQQLKENWCSYSPTILPSIKHSRHAHIHLLRHKIWQM
jgi:hypothetical protein